MKFFDSRELMIQTYCLISSYLCRFLEILFRSAYLFPVNNGVLVLIEKEMKLSKIITIVVNMKSYFKHISQ